MSLPLLALLVVHAAPAICDVGRAALRDLPAPNPRTAGTSFHVGESPMPPDLLTACPGLRDALPAGYSLADDDARRRAGVHAPPRQGPQPRPAYIYYLGLPRIAADGRHAVVKVTLDCTGLCGLGLEMHYVRTPDGWRRDGPPRTLWVS